MEKTTAIIASALVLVLFFFAFANAEAGREEEPEKIVDRVLYYNEHINHKIRAAELDAGQKDSPYEDIRCLARHGEMEAAFYRDNRSRLIKEMLGQGLRPEDHKVHLYLIRAFHEAHPEAEDMCK